MKTIFKLLLMSALVASPAVAQMTAVSASSTGGAGHLISNATVYWQAVNATRIGTTGGQALGVPVSATVTGGAFSVSVIDTSLSNPANTCYAVTIIDNATGDTLLGQGLARDGIHVAAGGPYGCVQPSGSSWNFDTFIPAAPPTAIVVAGPTGPAGATGANGTNCASGGSPSTCAFNGDTTTGPSLPSGVPASGVVASTSFYSPNGDFDPYAFGATGAGAVCDQAAIQAAANAAGALGGGIVHLHAGTFKVCSAISVPSGVKIRGSGEDCFNGFSGPLGTCIVYSGSGSAPFKVDTSVANEGYGFEISSLAVHGSGSGDDCIDLFGSSGSAPRSYLIRDVECDGYANTGIYTTGTSYGDIEHVSLIGGTNGMDFEPGGLFTEVSRYVDINTQAASQYGIKINAGNGLYFDKPDLNDSGTDNFAIFGANGPFDIFVSNLNSERAHGSGVELFANSSYMGRIVFQNSVINLAGNSSSEHAVWAHGTSPYTVFGVNFNWADINRFNSTAPTDTILTDAQSTVCFTQVRNASSDPVSINPCSIPFLSSITAPSFTIPGAASGAYVNADGTGSTIPIQNVVGTYVSVPGATLTSGQCSTATGTVNDATPSNTKAVLVSPWGGDPGGVYTVRGYISATGGSTDTVTVEVCAPNGGTLGAFNFQVRVIK